MNRLLYYTLFLFVSFAATCYSSEYKTVTIVEYQNMPPYDEIISSFKANFSGNFLVQEFNAKGNKSNLIAEIKRLEEIQCSELILAVGSVAGEIVLEHINRIPVIVTGIASPDESSIINNWVPSENNYTVVEIKDKYTKMLKSLHNLTPFLSLGMVYIKPSHSYIYNECKRFCTENNITFVSAEVKTRDRQGVKLSKEKISNNIRKALKEVTPHTKTFFVQNSLTFYDNFELFNTAFTKHKVLSTGTDLYFGKGIALSITSDNVQRGRVAALYAKQIIDHNIKPKQLAMDVISTFNINLDVSITKRIGFKLKFKQSLNKISFILQ
jgi:ABC-type uncharacterized transport system substrate-binding protein